MPCLKLFAVLLGPWVMACTPALDWREVRPEGSGATALFPCKPTRQVRVTPLAGERVSMTLVACSAAGITFSLAHADLVDPARVASALVEMRTALAANLGAGAGRGAAVVVPGMAPNPEALKVRIEGRALDGSSVQEEALVFARGTRVFQAVVLGAKLDDAAASIFFESLRLPS